MVKFDAVDDALVSHIAYGGATGDFWQVGGIGDEGQVVAIFANFRAIAPAVGGFRGGGDADHIGAHVALRVELSGTAHVAVVDEDLLGNIIIWFRIGEVEVGGQGGEGDIAAVTVIRRINVPADARGETAGVALDARRVDADSDRAQKKHASDENIRAAAGVIGH